jgi:hypothetical protein
MSEIACLHQTVESQSPNVSDAVTPVSFDRCRLSAALSLLTVTDKRPQNALVLARIGAPLQPCIGHKTILEVHLKTEGSNVPRCRANSRRR